MKERMDIVLTATKTGGHILPATAVAAAINHLNHDVTIHMITSGAKIEETILRGTNLNIHVLASGSIKGTGRIQRLVNIGRLPLSVLSAAKLLRTLKPAVVAGFGGFTTGPVLLGARILGLPTAILEANSIPGLTNRLSGKFVNKVFISLQSAKRYFPKDKTELTGTPVRHEITMVKKGNYAGPAKNILVFGGSQGARYLNESVPELLARAASGMQGVSVLHQAGEKGVDTAIKAYKDAGIDATVSPYMQDMAGAYKWADFVIARAGAGTISELVETGLPSLLIPFPFAADDHQYYNALELKERGAALMVRQDDIDPDSLAAELREVLSSAHRLNQMSESARAMSMGNAAEIIAEKLLHLAGIKR